MKIRCDVCEKEEATVFCSADDAPLCQGCDRRVHHANKLAGKHLRFSLLQPSSKDSPVCDICLERRALLFCKEDRAILCRECDISIHRANGHTQKHNRFLLTGVKLSAAPSSYQASSTSSGSISRTKSDNGIRSSATSENFGPNPNANISSWESNSSRIDSDHCISQEGSASTSSISEYLMETLPGWHVEDFLDPSSPFSKTYDQTSNFADHELGSNFGCFSITNFTNWVATQDALQLANGTANGVKGSEGVNNVMRVGRNWREDGPTVPVINPAPIKKSRQFP